MPEFIAAQDGAEKQDCEGNAAKRWLQPHGPRIAALPRYERASTAAAWLSNLENTRAVVLVTQGTLANFDFNQLVNPALLGLAQEDVQVIVTAGGSNADTIVAPKREVMAAWRQLLGRG
jgi:UDP:flavonoid glycosyltransferase YjiC (YdhE family)